MVRPSLVTRHTTGRVCYNHLASDRLVETGYNVTIRYTQLHPDLGRGLARGGLGDLQSRACAVASAARAAARADMGDLRYAIRDVLGLVFRAAGRTALGGGDLLLHLLFRDVC